MASIHQATIVPSKLEILGAWLPRQPWYTGTGEPQRVASYRFDDPAGEVGLEAIVVDAGAATLFHVPCSYRARPLDGADDYLLGTAEHSVLGTRYFYDAAKDPVWASALASAIVSGGVQAEEVLPDGTVREPSMRVRGSGSGGSVDAHGVVTTTDADRVTLISAGDIELILVRAIGVEITADQVLTGTWDGSEVTLAGLQQAPALP